MANSPETTTPVFEWRLVHDGVGKTPNVRTNASSWVYKGDLWVSCGAGSGQGKSSEIWRFDMAIKSWTRVAAVGGDAPCNRDGQSGTYIGDGKFVIFGGQGFAEPNKKLGKESEGMKTQTHWKRDVFNDLWMFDCDSSKWSPIYPNGLSFPMGRRGHSAIYISKGHSNSDSHVGDNDEANGIGEGHLQQQSISKSNLKSQLTPAPHRESAESATDCIPGNTLLVYGGAGIELSKYTEQLYNDVWLYSFETNTWRRYETKGVEPTPVTDHKVERIGDNMIVVGGITNAKTNPSFTPTFDPANLSDFMVLNLMTSTWSFVPLYDNFGKSVRVNMHGFTLIPDTTIWSEIYVPTGHGHHHGNAKERLTAPLDSQKLFIFGGKQIVDSKQASTMKASRLKNEFDEQLLVLNLKENTLTPLGVRDGIPPMQRYSQVGFCGMSIETVEEILQYNAQEKRREIGTASNKHQTNHRHSSHLYIPKEIPQEETVLYIFGGCDVEYGGYCDPALFQLVKKNIPISSASNNGSSLLNVQSTLPESNRPSSPDWHAESIGTLSPARSGLFSSALLEGNHEDQQNGSIWVNLQNKQNLSNYNKDAPRSQVVREPMNWDEMKLSLTPSHSERVFDLKVKRASSRKLSAIDTTTTRSRSPNKSTAEFTAPPINLNDVDFAYRTVTSHNQGSPRSPWHLPSVGLLGTRASTASRSITSFGMSGGFGDERAMTAPDRMSRSGTGLLSQSRGFGNTSSAVPDIDPDILAQEKRKRIQIIKATLQPVVRHQTKVTARESYQKLFPKQYG